MNMLILILILLSGLAVVWRIHITYVRPEREERRRWVEENNRWRDARLAEYIQEDEA